MTLIVAGFSLLLSALIIFSVGTQPGSSTGAIDWIHEQTGENTKVPDAFDLNHTYSYNLYGAQKEKWTAFVKVNGDKTVVTLKQIHN